MTDSLQLLHELGARLALARKRRGLTQTQLAKRMGSTARTLYRLERGDGTVSLNLLARALNELELRDLTSIAAHDPVGAWASQSQPPKRVRGPNKAVRTRQKS